MVASSSASSSSLDSITTKPVLQPAAAFSRKDVVNQLGNSSDPEVAASIKAYMVSVFKSGKVDATKPSETLELAAKVEKRYTAAQVVEHSIQVGVV